MVEVGREGEEPLVREAVRHVHHVRHEPPPFLDHDEGGPLAGRGLREPPLGFLPVQGEGDLSPMVSLRRLMTGKFTLPESQCETFDERSRRRDALSGVSPGGARDRPVVVLVPRFRGALRGARSSSSRGRRRKGARRNPLEARGRLEGRRPPRPRARARRLSRHAPNRRAGLPMAGAQAARGFEAGRRDVVLAPNQDVEVRVTGPARRKGEAQPEVAARIRPGGMPQEPSANCSTTKAAHGSANQGGIYQVESACPAGIDVRDIDVARDCDAPTLVVDLAVGERTFAGRRGSRGNARSGPRHGDGS